MATKTLQQEVLDLEPGEKHARVRQIDGKLPLSKLPQEIATQREKLRNACATQMSRAKEATGGTYTVEVGDTQMHSGAFYLVAVVTRTE